MITAFSNFSAENEDFKLVIVGKGGWLYRDIYQQVTDLDLGERVIFTGFETDENLAELYKNAFSLIMPSYYEGFGIPILEAMAHNCPVISSHNSSLPEVGGDAAIYFDPKDHKDLKNKMKELINNQMLYSKLISAGKKRIKDFSWKKCGQETLKLLKNAAHYEL